MRTGSCTVQQALTTEAASVLKHSLILARRRGHAQVTPLHVAATLLSSSAAPSSNLLRRACLKSHPHHPASHPLHCRAIELCFNVALNRLPTNPPPSSGPLIHPNPSLSNALIAALKRAQAHQRRGCIELQQQQQIQQQPLLALKVELEQLIVSILDDPSVSRVMKEAGFSSTSVKNNIEEDSGPVLPPSSAFFFDPHKEIIRHGGFWQTHFMKSPREQNPLSEYSQREDLRVILELMVRKQGRRTNTVLVGDSVSVTEGLVDQLKRVVDRGEVPDVLKSAKFISLQLSYVHLRLMSKSDVDMKLSDLRAKICSLASERGGGGVIIHAGDLRWAVDDESRDGAVSDSTPVEHMIAEIGRLLFEFRSCNSNGGGAVSSRVWLMATASYQTYMRCQMRQPSLETQWALQAVVVPSGGLALSLQSPSGLDSRMTRITQYPFQVSKALSPKDEEDRLNLCAECTSNFEREASVFKPETKDINNGSTHLPCWLQPHKSQNHHKDALLELRWKWNRLCHSCHHARRNQIHLHHPLFDRSNNYPWSTGLAYNQDKNFGGPRSISFADSAPKPHAESPDSTAHMKNRRGNSHEREVPMQWSSEVSLHSLNRTPNQEVRTNLALGSALLLESATSKNQLVGFSADAQAFTQLLQENIPWQSEAIPSIVETILDCRSSEKKATWLLLQGSDRIGKRRLGRVMAESTSRSVDGLININASKLTSRDCSCTKTLAEALSKNPKCVVFIEDIDRAPASFTETLSEGLKNGFFEDQFGKEIGLAHGIFILTTSISTKLEDADENPDNVLKMGLWVEEIPPELAGVRDLKRRSESDPLPNESKKPRTGQIELDLNICAEEEEHDGSEGEDDVPSDLTQETDGRDLHLPNGILESIGARFTLSAGPDQFSRLSDNFTSKLHRAFEEARGSGEGNGRLSIDRAAVEGLMAASGSFLENLFEKWLREVFQTSLPTVGKGGKVRLGVEGKEGNVLDCGFMGSALPNRIHVD